MKGNLKTTTLADIHLPVRIGGDAALMKVAHKNSTSRERH